MGIDIIIVFGIAINVLIAVWNREAHSALGWGLSVFLMISKIGGFYNG